MRLVFVLFATSIATKMPHNQAFHADLPESHQNEEQEKVRKFHLIFMLSLGRTKKYGKLLRKVFKRE